MKRQLPQANIDGVLFYIDVQAEELRQADNAANRISFSVFRQKENGYTFLYDPQRKNSPRTKQEMVAHMDRLRWVTLPALMELDPQGLAIKYGIPLEELVSGDHQQPAPVVDAILRKVSGKHKQNTNGTAHHSRGNA